MRALSSLPSSEARALRAFAFDLDDTLLDRGKLSEAAYSALFRLKESGLSLVAVTGRPSGWGEVIARQWPIAGAVTENGAVHVVREGKGIARIEACSDAERRAR